MSNLKIKSFLYILLSISAFLWISIAIYSDIDLSNVFGFMLILPKVITIDLILVSIFAKWMWKWRIFQKWLVPFPDLNGTWEGFIKSSWLNPKTKKYLNQIPAILTIKQSFFKINCVMHTSEMKSISYSENLIFNNEKQIRKLIYNYASKPRILLSDRSIYHEGTICFDIIGNPPNKLKGEYWTNRKTNGEIMLSFKSKNIDEEI